MAYSKGQPIEINDTFTIDGVETNPTAIVYKILGPDGVVQTFNWPGSPAIANPSTGMFVLSLSPPTFPGTYYYDVDSSGAVVASRSGNFAVEDDAASPTEVTWAVLGPCSPWATADDVWACCDSPMVTVTSGTLIEEVCVDMTQFAAEANGLLWELSGGLYSGRCSKTVRPCSRSRPCGWQVLDRGHIVWNGEWWGNGRRSCGCTSLDRILLSGYPVRAISEVKIDGAVLASSAYRLDERRYLSRVDGSWWPSCQNMGLADTEVGTFAVTYGFGQDPPPLGVAAAAQLGCELYNACNGGDCALPTGTTRITRQGITVERLAFTTWAFKDGTWRTGLPLVDAFLGGYNPTAVRRRPSVYSPDGMQYARSLGQ